MRYDGPQYSCPNFDEALKNLRSLLTCCDEIREWAESIENEIESAREINDRLRRDNSALFDEVEELKLEINILSEETTK